MAYASNVPGGSPPSSSAVAATRALAAKRWRVAASLTTAMVFVYFGFISLVAFAPARLAALVDEGLSLGIVLGALVIVAAWALTFAYVSWANRVYDPALQSLRAHHDSDGAAADERHGSTSPRGSS